MERSKQSKNQNNNYKNNMVGNMKYYTLYLKNQSVAQQ